MKLVTRQVGSKALMPQETLGAPALRFMMAVAIFALLLGSCSSVGSTLGSVGSTLGGLFGGDAVVEDSVETANSSTAGTEQTAPSESGFVFGGDAEIRPRFSAPSPGGQGAPDLNSVPTISPTPSPREERERALAGLIADRANARHTAQGARTMPVAVRPLEPSSSNAANAEAPPVPEPAVIDPVTRLADVPPPRPAEAEGEVEAEPEAPAFATAESADVVSSLPSAPPAPGPAPTTTPSKSIVSNESNTIPAALTDRFKSLSTFNAADFVVSSQITSLPSAARGLTLRDREILQDAANLRSDVQGILRVLGHGGRAPTQAAILAARVAVVLMTMGVPADRLYVGADAQSGPVVEVFLDY